MQDRLRPVPHYTTGEGYFHANDSFASWHRCANELLLQTARGAGRGHGGGGEETSPHVGGFQQMTPLIVGSAGWLMCFYE